VAEPNTAALIPRLRQLGMDQAGVHRVFATFNVAAPGFRAARDQAAGGGTDAAAGGGTASAPETAR
jgi:hypothetical protein